MGIKNTSLDLPYRYAARVVRVLDGDTAVLNCNLGFRVFIELSCRLAHIDAPELHSPDDALRAKAVEARQKLIELVADPNVIIRSFKPFRTEKYGRWLVEVYNSDGVYVNQTLLDLGLAEPYEGKKII